MCEVTTQILEQIERDGFVPRSMGKAMAKELRELRIAVYGKQNDVHGSYTNLELLVFCDEHDALNDSGIRDKARQYRDAKLPYPLLFERRHKFIDVNLPSGSESLLIQQFGYWRNIPL